MVATRQRELLYVDLLYVLSPDSLWVFFVLEDYIESVCLFLYIILMHYVK